MLSGILRLGSEYTHIDVFLDESGTKIRKGRDGRSVRCGTYQPRPNCLQETPRGSGRECELDESTLGFRQKLKFSE